MYSFKHFSTYLHILNRAKSQTKWVQIIHTVLYIVPPTY